MRLTDERGYDATTVDDIAETAGISQRTFFRYFPTKDDAILLGYHRFEELVDVFVPPADFGEALDALDDLYDHRVALLIESAPETFLATQRIIVREPKIRDVALARECATSQRLLERFRAAYPDRDDLALRVTLEVAAGVFRAARISWWEGTDTSASGLLRCYREARECFGRLHPPSR